MVVATRDRPQLLDECLASLRRALDERDELIVVDSASRDPLVRDVATTHRATYIRVDLPGAARARNVGWRKAAHAAVGFVDDDVRVAADWGSVARDALADRPKTGFVTARIDVPEDDRGRDRPVALMDESEPNTFDVTSVDAIGHGACVVVRRDALERIGGFDELLGPGAPLCAAEDHDLFDRILTAGYGGAYDPAMRAEHRQWRTRPELVRLDYRYGKGAGARISKLLRSDETGELRVALRRRARAVAVSFLWELGLRQAWRSLREGYRYGFLFAMAKVFGTASGFIRAAFIAVVDGRLTARRPKRASASRSSSAIGRRVPRLRRMSRGHRATRP